MRTGLCATLMLCWGAFSVGKYDQITRDCLVPSLSRGLRYLQILWNQVGMELFTEWLLEFVTNNVYFIFQGTHYKLMKVTEVIETFYFLKTFQCQQWNFVSTYFF